MIAASPYIRLGGLLCKREEHDSPSLFLYFVQGGQSQAYRNYPSTGSKWTNPLGIR